MKAYIFRWAENLASGSGRPLCTTSVMMIIAESRAQADGVFRGRQSSLVPLLKGEIISHNSGWVYSNLRVEEKELVSGAVLLEP